MFTMNAFYISFVVSHDMGDYCHSLKGLSGSPVLNIDGEIVGVVFGGPKSNCRHVEAIPLEGFNSINLMSPLKDRKESILQLVMEQESVFYDHLLSAEENKKDLAMIMADYGTNSKLLSRIVHSLGEDYLLNIYHKVFSSGQELDEREEMVYKLLFQEDVVYFQEFDFNKAAQLGNMRARFVLGFEFYKRENFKKAHQLFQESIQSRISLHLYQLSKVYYAEENLSQACRLLTYAEEPVEALDDLYQKYECDGVLSGT